MLLVARQVQLMYFVYAATDQSMWKKSAVGLVMQITKYTQLDLVLIGSKEGPIDFIFYTFLLVSAVFIAFLFFSP